MADEDRRAGEQRAPQRGPLPPDPVRSAGHSGSTRSSRTRPAARRRAPGRRACGGAPRRWRRRRVHLDVGRAVEVRLLTVSPSGPGSSENIQRIGWFTANTHARRAAAPARPRALPGAGSATNGTAPNAEHARSNVSDRNGSRSASACTSGTPTPVAAFSGGRVAQHPAGQVQRDRPRTLRGAASASTAPSRSRPPARPPRRRRRAAGRPPPAAPPGTTRSRRRRCPRRARRGSRRRPRPTSGGWPAGLRRVDAAPRHTAVPSTSLGAASVARHSRPDIVTVRARDPHCRADRTRVASFRAVVNVALPPVFIRTVRRSAVAVQYRAPSRGRVSRAAVPCARVTARRTTSPHPDSHHQPSITGAPH